MRDTLVLPNHVYQLSEPARMPDPESSKGCIPLPNISSDLLAILRCPVTGSALEQHGDVLRSAGPDAAGNFVEYPIDESIPVLLRPELRTAESTSAATPTPASTAEESPSS